MTELERMGEKARAAARVLAGAGAKKQQALLHAADCLSARAEEVLKANAGDLEAAQAQGMRPALQDRLRLTTARIEDMCRGLRETAAYPDPVGRVLEGTVRPNGLCIEKVCVPLGVIGIIFEARPNVTSDAAGLCIQAGNAVILRGGKEAFHSNCAVVRILRDALEEAGLPADCVQLVMDTSRESANEMMRLTGYLDVLIPRGGAGLIRAVVENSTIPVIETGTGNCHIFVDASADLSMAVDIIINAKTQRVGVCNACESLLIHREVKDKLLPVLAARLQEKHVEIRGDQEICELVPDAVTATEEDWGKEYLDYVISMKTVDSVDEAIAHINRYNTGHSEAIITESYTNSQKFLDEVDAAFVYVNASTRFTDGFEFGFGAEIGISTQKLHARGPMGLLALTTTKYIIYGNGQVRP